MMLILCISAYLAFTTIDLMLLYADLRMYGVGNKEGIFSYIGSADNIAFPFLISIIPVINIAALFCILADTPLVRDLNDNIASWINYNIYKNRQ